MTCDLCFVSTITSFSAGTLEAWRDLGLRRQLTVQHTTRNYIATSNQGLKTDRVFFAVIVPCHIIDETHCIFEIWSKTFHQGVLSEPCKPWQREQNKKVLVYKIFQSSTAIIMWNHKVKYPENTPYQAQSESRTGQVIDSFLDRDLVHLNWNLATYIKYCGPC